MTGRVASGIDKKVERYKASLVNGHMGQILSEHCNLTTAF
jgi:hypothetical protein